jgi:serine/threonine protein kinase
MERKKIEISGGKLGAHIATKAMQSISGQTYTIDGNLGDGAYSDVFSVRRSDGEVCAFKRFKRESSDLGLGVLREISILQILRDSHKGLINLLDTILLDDDEQTFGVVVPRYQTDLHSAIKNDAIPAATRKSLSFSLAETVHFLHSNGIIHRDIKPENILLDADMVPVLADYTLAKVFTVSQRCSPDPAQVVLILPVLARLHTGHQRSSRSRTMVWLWIYGPLELYFSSFSPTSW